MLEVEQREPRQKQGEQSGGQNPGKGRWWLGLGSQQGRWGGTVRIGLHSGGSAHRMDSGSGWKSVKEREESRLKAGFGPEPGVPAELRTACTQQQHRPAGFSS